MEFLLFVSWYSICIIYMYVQNLESVVLFYTKAAFTRLRLLLTLSSNPTSSSVHWKSFLGGMILSKERPTWWLLACVYAH